jgi:hypothetical protein
MDQQAQHQDRWRVVERTGHAPERRKVFDEAHDRLGEVDRGWVGPNGSVDRLHALALSVEGLHLVEGDLELFA